MIETETPTPTLTLTPTQTSTPTATFTPTLDYYVEMTTEAGEPARLLREVTVADTTSITLQAAILLSIWVMWLAQQLKK